MTPMISKERRSYVRGDLSFKVRFKVMTPEEYETVKMSGNQIVSPDRRLSVDSNNTNRGATQITPNAFMIDFLLQLDEKLDQILAMLSKDGEAKGLLNQGMGVSISGSGMSIIADKPVEPGQIIHANFVLSRLPLVFIDLFGQVVRVAPVDEDGEGTYHLGIKFLDLDPDDRERIIAYVFQKQREIIRIRKSER
ncbi:hypothetical protein ES703_124342 [subsurface metagenome]